MNKIQNNFSIEEKKEIIKKTWLLKPTKEIPFIIDIEPRHTATKKYFQSDKAELDWNLNYHNEQRKGINDYSIPNIKLNKGIGLIASAFGCNYHVNEKADPWIKPIIFEKNVNDVYDLAIPDVKKNNIFKEVYNRIEFFQLNSDLPIRLAKIPSPLVTASLIWDYTSFVTAMILYPKEVHSLLEKITIVTIDFINEQLSRIKNLFAMSHEMLYIPKNFGIRISDDVAALLSPTLYKEFGVKYNTIISKAFRGIIVHSCGDMQNVVETMMEIEGLRGLDFTLPNNSNWEIIKKTVVGKVALNLRYWHADLNVGSEVDFLVYTNKIVEFFGQKGIFLQTSALNSEQARNYADNFHKILT